LEEDSHEQINRCDRSVDFDGRRYGGNYGEDWQDGIRRDLPGHGRKTSRRQHHRTGLIGFRDNRLDRIEWLAVELELCRGIVGAHPGRWRQRVELVLNSRRPGLDQRQHRHRQRLHDLDIVAIERI
jgi:hypothetical protein